MHTTTLADRNPDQRLGGHRIMTAEQTGKIWARVWMCNCYRSSDSSRDIVPDLRL